MKFKVVNPNKYSGCFLGLAIGDALGAPFEGGVIDGARFMELKQLKKAKYSLLKTPQELFRFRSNYMQYRLSFKKG